MGCSGCSSGGCSPAGCGNKGSCSTGGCNRLNTFDWLSQLEISDVDHFDVIEVSFKQGARKQFYRDDRGIGAMPGEMVVVDTGQGYDIGRVGLVGELVRLQLKKKRVRLDSVIHSVIRKANERDIEKLEEARSREIPVMIKARVIARKLELDMKLGDVEYQADMRKATFYYTAEGRVDFRELVREYAREFRVKIEMRQIGARQESARIGGIGSCGRELCCSTWLTDFKSVTTSAARYQNLSINQSKLSGQCGRLKCCLNYELDTYMEAMEEFPEQADYLQGLTGRASLIKIDIFKGLMFYSIEVERGRPRVIAMAKEQVREAIKANKAGNKIDLMTLQATTEIPADDSDTEGDYDFSDVTGAIELPAEKKRRSSRGRKSNRRSGGSSRQRDSASDGGAKASDSRSQKKNSDPQGKANTGKTDSGPRSRGRGKPRGNKNRNNQSNKDQ